RFWPCYSRFESLPGSARWRLVPSAAAYGTAPSSSGLGHHPLKVAARVRIPLGLPETPSSGNIRPDPLSASVPLRLAGLGDAMRGHMRRRGEAWELRVYVGRDAVPGGERYATRTV